MSDPEKVALGERVWLLEPKATGRLRNSFAALRPRACGCLWCRNFLAAAEGSWPAEWPEDAQGGAAVSEVHHLGRVEPGTHAYAGRLVLAVNEGPSLQPEEDWLQCAGDWQVRARAGEVPDQLSLEFRVELPWVLEEPETL